MHASTLTREMQTFNNDTVQMMCALENNDRMNGATESTCQYGPMLHLHAALPLKLLALLLTPP